MFSIGIVTSRTLDGGSQSPWVLAADPNHLPAVRTTYDKYSIRGVILDTDGLDPTGTLYGYRWVTSMANLSGSDVAIGSGLAGSANSGITDIDYALNGTSGYIKLVVFEAANPDNIIASVSQSFHVDQFSSNVITVGSSYDTKQILMDTSDPIELDATGLTDTFNVRFVSTNDCVKIINSSLGFMGILNTTPNSITLKEDGDNVSIMYSPTFNKFVVVSYQLKDYPVSYFAHQVPDDYIINGSETADFKVRNFVSSIPFAKAVRTFEGGHIRFTFDNHYNETDFQFVAPNSGLYTFSFVLKLALTDSSNTVGSTPKLSIQMNGPNTDEVALIEDERLNPSGPHLPITVHSTVTLTVMGGAEYNLKIQNISTSRITILRGSALTVCCIK